MVSDLKAILPGCIIKGSNTKVGDIKIDSRNIKKGDTFIALRGSTTDGHRFISDAIKRGASVIICEKGSLPDDIDVTYIEVADTRKALEILLPLRYPKAKDVTLVGITGTNGKTTTAYLLEAILSASGKAPGVIGTIETRYKGRSIPSVITTPSPIELFETLHNMKESGVGACIMEVSSHGLHQDRISALKFDYAIFTNLSQDHLDYHKDMDAYFAAKKKLFYQYLSGKAIINIDDPYGQSLAGDITTPITFGTKNTAMVRPSSVEVDPRGISLVLETPRGVLNIKSHLLGGVQVYNIMASVSAAIAMNIEKDAIAHGICSLKKVPGRMEVVKNPYGINIVVDFAHTPHALSKAIEAARTLTQGRVVTVFGCGGDRDRSKRSQMGRIVSLLSDVIIVTSDNPRTEDPDSIIKDILSGINGLSNVEVEPDRRKAIMLGLKSVSVGDCLLIAGKGHEQYQIVGREKSPFDDKEVALSYIKEVFGP
ncbi:MAG: UDP-N-acetylmuramoyl-L-alanyl-D-glutamate--2,6-diaminopimelate ligase [Deltaproteobacteria bacterium]|nr:UDP-N-acetylmuramoyl-L-alanyl-D-glutamate--2,6-diaminopimelate ligase [Deltaproteobacteria bacterium]